MNTDWKDNYWQHRIKGNSALMSFIRATLTLFSTWPTDVEIDLPMSGHEKLHAVFGLSYAKWLNLPRSLMYAMPDSWQDRMAELLDEFVNTFDVEKIDDHLRNGANDDIEWLQYRHPDTNAIDSMRRANVQ